MRVVVRYLEIVCIECLWRALYFVLKMREERIALETVPLETFEAVTYQLDPCLNLQVNEAQISDCPIKAL